VSVRISRGRGRARGRNRLPTDQRVRLGAPRTLDHDPSQRQTLNWLSHPSALLGSFMFTEKLIRKQSSHMPFPLLIVPLLFTSCFNVAHLLSWWTNIDNFYSLQSIVYIRGSLMSYILWVLTNAMTCNHHYCITQNSPSALKLNCASPIHSSLHRKIQRS